MFVFTAPSPTAATPARRAAGGLFDPLFAARAATADATPRVPALDVSETDAGFTLSFEVPGATRDQLQVTVQGRRVQLDTLAAAAQAPAQAGAEGERSLYRERAPARYARTVALPAEVDPAGAVARCEHGVLTLALPKRVPSGATRVTVG